MPRSYPEPLALAMREFVPPGLFPRLPVRANADWTPQRLAWVATIMAWDEGQTFDARFEHARRAARDRHPHRTLEASYCGFTKALVRASPALTEALGRRFRRQMRAMAGARRRRGRWAAFAVDGTRIEAPHTAANEAGLGCAGRDAHVRVGVLGGRHRACPRPRGHGTRRRLL